MVKELVELYGTLVLHAGEITREIWTGMRVGNWGTEGGRTNTPRGQLDLA
jgi:hypothetical protein